MQMNVVERKGKERNKRQSKSGDEGDMGEAAQGNEHQEVKPGLARSSYIVSPLAETGEAKCRYTVKSRL